MSSGETAGGIKAGMAYVQAYLDDAPFTQGLAKLQMKLKSWQANLSKTAAGAYGGELPEPFAALARFAASPAGAFAALLGTAKHTADAREEMLRMSETTGVAVDKLSALSYAARRAGISNETLADGLRKMQGKEFQSMLQGVGGKKANVIADLGLDKSGDAADQFRQIVGQFEKLDSVSRIGLAKKLGLTELLPLINQGVAGLDALTKRARDMGLVMSEEDAKAGKQFVLAMGDLHEILMSCVSQIGGALLPVITGLTNVIVKTVLTVRDWIKNHQELTQEIFFLTAAVVVGGITIKAFAVFVGIAGKALVAFQAIVTGVKFAITAFNTVLDLLPLLTNPYVLMGLAIVAIGAALLYASGAFDRFGELLKSMAGDAATSVGAISHAIAAGGMKEAWNVVCTGFKLMWQETILYLRKEWQDFTAWLFHSSGAQGLLTGMLGTNAPTVQMLAALGNTAGQSGVKEQEDKVKKLRSEFEVAVKSANALKIPGGEDGEKKKAIAAGQAAEVRGTFSGAVAELLGGGEDSGEKEMIELQRQAIIIQEQTRDGIYKMREALIDNNVIQ
jgi:hypothetical protein